MISEQEAQQLIEKFISLRKIANETKLEKDVREFRVHEEICLSKFKYLIDCRTYKYKSFANYDDLNQEGFEALIKSMKNYNPEKGNFFWWSHKYIDTRIARTANLHTTIRFPMKYAKINTPKRESNLPLLIEHRFCPDLQLVQAQAEHLIKSSLHLLNEKQKYVLYAIYGIDGDKPMSINKVCKNLDIPRTACVAIIKSAFATLRENIKL